MKTIFTLKNELETVSIIILVTVISLFFFSKHDTLAKQPVVSPVFLALQPSPKPTLPSLPTKAVPELVIAPTVEVTTYDSPDGTKTLTMKKLQDKNLMNYAFYTSSSSDPTQKLVFSKSVDVSHTLSVPFNTWSPDDAYIFLKDTSTSVTTWYAISAAGNLMANNALYESIQDIFPQSYPTNTITDVTGWASPTLLIVNTNTNQGAVGPSLWFDVTDQSLTQLSTRFN